MQETLAQKLATSDEASEEVHQVATLIQFIKLLFEEVYSEWKNVGIQALR